MYMYDIWKKTQNNFHVICEKLIWHLIPLTVVWYQRRKDIYILYRWNWYINKSINLGEFLTEWIARFSNVGVSSFLLCSSDHSYNWIWIKLRQGLLVDLRDNIHCIKYCKSADFAIAYIYDLQFISLGKGDCVYLLCLFSNHDFTDI